jgi:4-hydroxybenzoate polyprenyltransferase
MKPLVFFYHLSLSLIVGGLALLGYVLFHLPALQLLGISVSILSFGVALYCAWLWNRKVDVEQRNQASTIAQLGYIAADLAGDNQVKFKLWYQWKKHECAKFPQFWAMFIWIMYVGALSLVSMYLDSLPAPCVERHDCVSTEARGIYIGGNK